MFIDSIFSSAVQLHRCTEDLIWGELYSTHKQALATKVIPVTGAGSGGSVKPLK